MNRTFLIYFLILTLFSLSSGAQTKLALRAGVNLTTARIRYNAVNKDRGFHVGPHLGLQLDTEFEGPLHFNPFIAYNLRGYDIKNVNDSISLIKNHIHYIDLAAPISYHFSKGKKQEGLYIMAGPVMGLAFSGKEKTTVNGVTTSRKMQFSITGKYGFIDMSMLGGIGYRRSAWYVEANYLFGLGNINNNVNNDKRNIQNRSIGLHAGYYFKRFR